MRRMRRAGRRRDRAARSAGGGVPRALRAPSGRTRRRRRRARRGCTSVRSACAAHRARGRAARAAVRTCAGPRGPPRAGGLPPPTPGALPRPDSLGTAPVGPARLDLREDALAELVAGTREREGDVRMEALEAPTPARAADAVVQRGTPVTPGGVTGELPSQPPLLVVSGGEPRGERGLRARRLAPALDASGGLEPRHGRDEMPAGQVVHRRERLAVRPVRALLGDGRSPERAPHRDTAERPRLAAQLARYEGSISVGDHGAQHDGW